MKTNLLKKEKGVEGKVCVVTGAAGVLCASLTEDLLRHGAKVAVLDLRGDVARELCAKLAKKGLKERRRSSRRARPSSRSGVASTCS